MALGGMISFLANKKNVSTKKLSDDTNIPYTTLYSMMKRNSGKADTIIIEELSRYFGVSSDYLLCRTTQAKVDYFDWVSNTLLVQIASVSDPGEKQVLQSKYDIAKQHYDDYYKQLQGEKKIDAWHEGLEIKYETPLKKYERIAQQSIGDIVSDMTDTEIIDIINWLFMYLDDEDQFKVALYTKHLVDMKKITDEWIDFNLNQERKQRETDNRKAEEDNE